MNSSVKEILELLESNPNFDRFVVSRDVLLELVMLAQKPKNSFPDGRKEIKPPPAPPPARVTNCFGYETKESREATEAWRRNNSKKQ